MNIVSCLLIPLVVLGGIALFFIARLIFKLGKKAINGFDQLKSNFTFPALGRRVALPAISSLALVAIVLFSFFFIKIVPCEDKQPHNKVASTNKDCGCPLVVK